MHICMFFWERCSHPFVIRCSLSSSWRNVIANMNTVPSVCACMRLFFLSLGAGPSVQPVPLRPFPRFCSVQPHTMSYRLRLRICALHCAHSSQYPTTDTSTLSWFCFFSFFASQLESLNSRSRTHRHMLLASHITERSAFYVQVRHLTYPLIPTSEYITTK